jgi:hypothetical protein
LAKNATEEGSPPCSPQIPTCHNKIFYVNKNNSNKNYDYGECLIEANL